MSRFLQRTFQRYPRTGIVGSLARPGEPFVTDVGRLHVPSASTRNPRPGDMVYYDTSENAFAAPTSAAQILQTCGIITFRDHVSQAQSTDVEYEDDEQVQVLRMGAVYVTAGAAVEYNALITQSVINSPDWQWDPLTVPANFGALVDFPIYCASTDVAAAGAVMVARIGYGRVK